MGNALKEAACPARQKNGDATHGKPLSVGTCNGAVPDDAQVLRDEFLAIRRQVAEDIEELRAEVAELREENTFLRQAIARGGQPTFSIAHYNILAGYLGNNREPWFLYGVDLTRERRDAVLRKHGERGADGKYVNVGWPSYVEGILTEAEIRTVEEVDRTIFQWEVRRERLMKTIARLDVDVVCLVECDHFDDRADAKPTASGHDPRPGFFKRAMAELGYDGIWRKRPRPESHDGCAIFWRKSVFHLQAHDSMNLVDDIETGRTDRTCLIALLRMVETGQEVVILSSHLARNPEEVRLDMLRAKQGAQIFRFAAEFLHKHDVLEAPVVLSADLNAITFDRILGLVEAIQMLVSTTEHSVPWPMVFDLRDVPTGPTSFTECRNVRIDALVYRSRRLELKQVKKLAELDAPIPDRDYPSDHLPIRATFGVRSDVATRSMRARAYVLALIGVDCEALNELELDDIFLFFDWTGTGQVDQDCLLRVLGHLDLGLRQDDVRVLTQRLVRPPKELLNGLGLAPPAVSAAPAPTGVSLQEFKELYAQTLKARLPQRFELSWAFSMLDRSGDGSLDYKELETGLRAALPVELPEAYIRSIFQEMDLNGDGSVSWDEFLMYSAAKFAKFFCGGLGPPTPTRHPPTPTRTPLTRRGSGRSSHANLAALASDEANGMGRYDSSSSTVVRYDKGWEGVLGAAGCVLVDVRSAADFARKSLKGSRSFPCALSEDPVAILERGIELGDLPDDVETPILVYCAAGGRSQRVAAAFEQLGYANVAHVGDLDLIIQAGAEWA